MRKKQELNSRDNKYSSPRTKHQLPSSLIPKDGGVSNNLIFRKLRLPLYLKEDHPSSEYMPTKRLFAHFSKCYPELPEAKTLDPYVTKISKSATPSYKKKRKKRGYVPMHVRHFKEEQSYLNQFAQNELEKLGIQQDKNIRIQLFKQKSKYELALAADKRSQSLADLNCNESTIDPKDSSEIGHNKRKLQNLVSKSYASMHEILPNKSISPIQNKDLKKAQSYYGSFSGQGNTITTRREQKPKISLNMRDVTLTEQFRTIESQPSYFDNYEYMKKLQKEGLNKLNKLYNKQNQKIHKHPRTCNRYGSNRSLSVNKLSSDVDNYNHIIYGMGKQFSRQPKGPKYKKLLEDKALKVKLKEWKIQDNLKYSKIPSSSLSFYK